MSLITNISQHDAATLITKGIVSEIRDDIYERLLDWIRPQLKSIATNAAESVTKKATVEIYRDFQADLVRVMVNFVEPKDD